MGTTMHTVAMRGPAGRMVTQVATNYVLDTVEEVGALHARLVSISPPGAVVLFGVHARPEGAV